MLIPNNRIKITFIALSASSLAFLRRSVFTFDEEPPFEFVDLFTEVKFFLRADVGSVLLREKSFRLSSKSMFSSVGEPGKLPIKSVSSSSISLSFKLLTIVNIKNLKYTSR